jgi:hypothetical protein
MYDQRYSFRNNLKKPCLACGEKPKRLFIYVWSAARGLFCNYNCFTTHIYLKREGEEKCKNQ